MVDSCCSFYFSWLGSERKQKLHKWNFVSTGVCSDTLGKETVVSLVKGSENLTAMLSSINGLWIPAWIELNYVNGWQNSSMMWWIWNLYGFLALNKGFDLLFIKRDSLYFIYWLSPKKNYFVYWDEIWITWHLHIHTPWLQDLFCNSGSPVLIHANYDLTKVKLNLKTY